MKIESIKVGKYDKGKLVIKMTDGTYVSACAEDAYMLKVGSEITEEEASALNGAYETSRAKMSAARSLAHHSMSKKTLSDKLRKKGFSEENAEKTVSWFEDKGLVGDCDFAKSCVEYYKNRGYGKIRIREELRRRGISRELSESLLSDFEDSEETVTLLIAKKLKRKEFSDENKRKITAFLLRRGFTYDEIKAAFAKMKLNTEDFD